MTDTSVGEWWAASLREYEADGSRDADIGIYDPPYPSYDADPEYETYNDYYKRGFDRRRKELGRRFRWR